MKTMIVMILMTAGLAGPAGAWFPGLPEQLVNPGAIWNSGGDEFPQPSPALDNCVFLGLKDGVCRFKCASGDTPEMKPVKPGAADAFEACGVAASRAADKSDRTMEDWRSVDLETADGGVISVDYVAYYLGGKITATRVWVSLRNPALKASDKVTAKLSNFYEATDHSSEALQTAAEAELPFNGWNFQARFPPVSIYEAHHAWHHDFVQEIEVSVNGRPLAAKAGSLRFRMEGPSSPVQRGEAGTLKGKFAGAGAELSYDGRAGRITGKLFDLPADITIDSAAGTVKGRVNGADIDLKLYRGAELEGLKGAANGDTVEYTINWKQGLAEGFGNKTPFLIMWDPAELSGGGTAVKLSGYVNHAVLELSYDRGSGRITGDAGHGRVDIRLSGWDLRDFIRWYFVFMKPHTHK